MKPKNLQEFIENKARPMYQTLEDGSGVQLRQSFALEALAEITAKHLLEVARERCWDHACYAEGRLVNHDNPDEAWGEQKSANDLLELLESYCAPVEDLKK